MRKKIKFGAVMMSALALSGVTSMATAADVGIGTNLATSLDEGSGLSTILVPIRSGNFRFEPELSTYKSSSETVYPGAPVNNNNGSSKYMSLGTGVYWRQSVGQSTQLFIGGRIGIIRNEYTYSPSTGTAGYTSKTSGTYIGPTVGAEYSFNQQFSIGLDLSLIRRSGSTERRGTTVAQDYTTDFTSYSSETRASLRYYF